MVYYPAWGAVDVPHPRTAADILLRSLANQTFAAVAYGHLLYLLGYRKPPGVGSLSVLLIPVFVLLPEVVLLQLGFVVLPALFARSYRQRVADRFKALPIELGLVSGSAGGQNAGLGRLGLHAGFAVFNAIPLGAVIGAYRQRLRMQWHGRTYVANLGLDHRNGWAAAGGIAAVAITLVVIGGLAFIVAGGLVTGYTNLPTAGIAPADNDRGKAEQQHHTEHKSLLERVVYADGSAAFEVVCASLIHQILLAVTNHPLPAILIFKVWYLWPVVGAGLWYLYKRRRVDKLSIAFILVLAFVLLTVVSQLHTDLNELWEVTHNSFERWNWRWQVKDQVSAKIPQE